MAKHRFVIEGQAFEVDVHARYGDHADVSVNGARYRVEHAQVATAPVKVAAAVSALGAQARSSARVSSAAGELRAPMAGLVLRYAASVGDQVVRGQPLLVLDAMKMENTLGAPADGVVDELAVKPGTTVLQGALLARVRV